MTDISNLFQQTPILSDMQDIKNADHIFLIKVQSMKYTIMRYLGADFYFSDSHSNMIHRILNVNLNLFVEQAILLTYGMTITFVYHVRSLI